MAQSGRVPHALLFLGKEGSGHLPLALAFAQALQCVERTQEGEACGTCSACSKASKHIHPDIHYSFPTIGAKAVSTDFAKEWRAALEKSPYLGLRTWLSSLGPDNKQGNITAQECQAIVRKLSLKAFEGRYKILILWMPEFLAKEGNRLLKLIEEPPEDTLFILVAEDSEKILNTILSRCQTIKLDPLEDEEIAKALQGHHGQSPTRAQQIAFLSDGNFTTALDLVQNEISNDSEVFIAWFRTCFKGLPVEMVDWVEETAKIGRENQKQLLQYGLNFLREVLVFRSTKNTQLRLGEVESSIAVKMSKVLDFQKINLVSKILDDLYYHIERNANPKPLLLNASILMHKIMTDKI